MQFLLLDPAFSASQVKQLMGHFTHLNSPSVVVGFLLFIHKEKVGKHEAQSLPFVQT